jgi:hypothetical protein
LCIIFHGDSLPEKIIIPLGLGGSDDDLLVAVMTTLARYFDHLFFIPFFALYGQIYPAVGCRH